MNADTIANMVDTIAKMSPRVGAMSHIARGDLRVSVWSCGDFDAYAVTHNGNRVFEAHPDPETRRIVVGRYNPGTWQDAMAKLYMEALEVQSRRQNAERLVRTLKRRLAECVERCKWVPEDSLEDAERTVRQLQTVVYSLERERTLSIAPGAPGAL